MNEQLMRDCLRMYRERASFYKKIWLDNYNHGFNNVECLGKSDAYNNAAMMLEYALQDNAEILRQYDYFGEDN